MTDHTPKQATLTTAKIVPVVVNVNHHPIAGSATDAIPSTTTNVIAIVDSTSNAVVDAGRKKSGFVITRVDKASNSATILENNESDFENEINDHNVYVFGGGGSSPGSSSIMSEASTADGGSLEKPLNISRAPPSTPAGATPTSPAWTSAHQHHPRPGGLTAIISATSAAAGAAALLSAAANLPQQPSTAANQAQPATVVIAASSPSAQTAPPSTINRETSASSRFHIIKIETGPYKRGRWNCRDFDETASGSGSGAVRSDMIAVGPRSGSSSNSSGRPSYHIVAEENGHGAGDQTILLLSAASMSDHSTTSHHQTSQHAGGLASKPPLPPITGHHAHHHPSQQHSPLPTTLPHSQQSKTAVDYGSNASPATTTTTGPSKGVGVVKQASITSQHQPTSVLSSNYTSLSNFAQQQSHQRSQSPVVVTSPSAATTLSSSAVPAPVAPTPTGVSRFQVRPATVDLNNAAAAILDSIVGSMQHDNNRIVGRQPMSAISSSSAGSTAAAGATASASFVDGPIGPGGPAGMGQATAAVSLAPGSVGANVVAIDNKIEQAMDLVKTHLLYAVREEVEVLKEKIIDLEKKVFRLETENKLLREYAPPEILQQIQHQHHHQQPQSSGGVGTGSLVNSHTNSISSISVSSIPQTNSSQSSAHPATSHSSAPALTAQQSVHGTAMANINNPVTTTTASAALSQHPQQ